LAYTPGGILFEEFDRIFSDLFQHRASIYKHIVERLVDGVTDLDGICKALRVEKSGSVSEYLDVLVETGYVARDRTWNLKSGKESNLHHYRLSDNYLRYYLKYIQPHKTQIERGTMRRPPLWQGIMGLQFENLVLSNRLSLHALLGIRSEEIIYDNPFFQRATQAHKGCQIDYLIQTRFGTLYLCEIKFSKEKIGSRIIEEVREKVQRLSRPRHCSIRPVLIHVNGVTDDVLEAGYFSDVVDFGTLLR
ncbi:MAG: ATPase, partial [Chlamydiia bacterium]|nr:ATPase [Chlamydiia bacterium]